MSAPQFDEFARDYERTLSEGLSVSGEDSTYFAHGRVAWLKGRLEAHGARPKSGIDFGCGTGSSAPYLTELLQLESLVGVDVSSESIDVARKRHGSAQARFAPLAEHVPTGDIELAFCNGVFHHVPLAERDAAVAHVFRSLKPGGFWAFFENNPYNPGTRWIMSRLPFDRDAILLSARNACRLLESGGFQVAEVNYLFVFPNLLRHLRPVEPHLIHLPLGAQYLVLARKP